MARRRSLLRREVAEAPLTNLPTAPTAGDAEPYDVVVIGSGFGGSVMTYRLSEAGRRVCLLERGRAYPPGSFPRGVAGAQENFWAPDKGLHGLFDVWSFRRMAALVSSGLGGGSLIYANVLLRMPAEWFESTMIPGERWPLTYEQLKPHYEAVERMLGATEYPGALRGTTLKTVAFHDAAAAAKAPAFFPKLAITFAAAGREGEEFDHGAGNRFGVSRFACRLVGECDVGCNFGAKNSLDLTYLSRLGSSVEVLTRCEAKAISPGRGGYEVEYVDYERGRRGRLSARRVVVAAGTLGSTYLLLRSERLRPISPMLGRRFSANGDLLTFARGARHGDGSPRVIDAGRGPVITAAARVADPKGHYDLFIEDGGGPNAVWWVGEVLEAPRALFGFLPDALRVLRKALSGRPERELGGDLSDLLGDTSLAARALPLLGMGRDLPLGRLELREADGSLDLAWEPGDRRAYYRRANAVSKRFAAGLNARLGDLSFALNRYVTVHPLGGCPMGTSAETGVVDAFGRVFGHERLYVVDGAVMPGPIGANPSLTIAAFADRAADALLKEPP